MSDDYNEPFDRAFLERELAKMEDTLNGEGAAEVERLYAVLVEGRAIRDELKRRLKDIDRAH